MFSKKVATADYAPSGNILCCCGFFNTKRKRRQSCDVIGDNEDKKDEQSKENGSILSNGGSDHPPTYDSITADEKGRTKSQTSLDKNGAAYQISESSSSDSEDEVIKHYQETVERANSIRSHRSSRSKRSGRSSRSKPDPDPVVAAEEGEASERLSYHADTEDGGAEARSVHSGDEESVRDTQTFDNEAYMGEEDKPRSPDRLAGSDEEHLFDVSDLQTEPPLISKCGSLEVSFYYDMPHSRVIVNIVKAREIPAKDRGGANATQVRVMLLPGKKQRHKTKVKTGESPPYDEKIYFNKILPDELPSLGIRFRLYGVERMRRERMIGESIVGFASLNMEQETTHWVVLEPRSNLSKKDKHGESTYDVSSLSRSDSGSSTLSLQHGGMPELLLGLAYNGTTGRLSVEVIKGSNFRNMAMNRAPDTYVKLSLMNAAGQEVQHCKTSTRRGQPNPLFKETFMLQVALFQLPEVTLMVSVYNKKSMKKKEMIGWFSLGMNSSGEEEGSHWLDMRENKGDQVSRWHILLES